MELSQVFNVLLELTGRVKQTGDMFNDVQQLKHAKRLIDIHTRITQYLKAVIDDNSTSEKPSQQIIFEIENYLKGGSYICEKPKTYIDRLYIECDELDKKIESLTAFISTPMSNVTQTQKDLLRVQLDSMKTYQTCLKIRLNDLVLQEQV